MNRMVVTTTLLMYTIFLPFVGTSSRVVAPKPRAEAECEHPFYNDLAGYEGDEVCYDEVYVEQVFVFEPCEQKGRGAFIASVAYVHEGWYGAVWVRCFADACDVSAGDVISLTGTVLGTHAMAGNRPTNGIDIPALTTELQQ